MLWLFAAFGLAASGSVVCRLVVALRSGRGGWRAEAIAGLLLGLAWAAQHTRGAGWVALSGAVCIELIGWWRWWSGPLRAPSTRRESPLESLPAAPPSPAGTLPAVDRPEDEGGSSGEVVEDEAPAAETTADETTTVELAEDETAEVVSGGPDLSDVPSAPPPAEPTDDRATPAGPADAPPGDVPAGRLLSLTTFALLQSHWQAAGDVFFASLRRLGQRDAELLRGPSPGAADETIRIRVGTITLELVGAASPVAQDSLDYATRQTWDWPEAAESVGGHVAHVVVTTQAAANTSPALIVRLHHLAHAALSEFTPVLAGLWPEAGRLVPAASLTDLCSRLDDPNSLTSSCVNYRVFPLEGSDAGLFVADSVGLHAFGLPDVQVVTEGQPGEVVSAVVYELVGRFFSQGCSLPESSLLTVADGGQWQATRGRARFGPDREVLDVSAVSDDAPQEASNEGDSGDDASPPTP